MSPFARNLLLFALANALAGNLLLTAVFGTSKERTTLGHTRNLLRGEAWTDSWGPMLEAFEYLKHDPSQPVYSAIFFDQKVEFQYPVSALLVLSAIEVVRPEIFDQTKVTTGQRWRQRVVDLLNSVSVVVVFVAMGASILIFNLSATRGPPQSRTDLLVANAAVAILALTFYPIVKSYTLGQLQTWITALFTLTLLCWLRRWMSISGVLLGLCALLKPTYSLFLPWAILRGQWRFVLGFSVTILAGLLATSALFGLSHQLDYLHVLSFLGRHGDGYFPNQSVNGLLNRLLFDRGNLTGLGHLNQPFNVWVYGGTLVSSGVLIMAAFFWGPTAEHRGSVLDFAMMALTLTMASPIAWEHHYGILLPIFAFLAPQARERRLFGMAALVYLGCCYVLVGNYFDITKSTAGSAFNVVQSYLFFGALMLLVFLYQQGGRWTARRSNPG